MNIKEYLFPQYLKSRPPCFKSRYFSSNTIAYRVYKNFNAHLVDSGIYWQFDYKNKRICIYSTKIVVYYNEK